MPAAIWDDYVQAAASHWSEFYGIPVDPALVHGIIERESRHGQDPNYIAHGGIVPEPGGHVSYGPMQVYDDTLATVIAPGSGITGADLANQPELGIWWGTKYLAIQLKRFGGDVNAAISAYNAGPGNAKRNPTTGNFPNQSYVNAVLGFWNKYKGALAVAPFVLAAALIVFLMRRGR